MRIESGELRIFLAVVEENGFNRAAGKLHVSQSAVSQSVANLERKLSTPLLQRGKRLKLTQAGERLFDHARATLREEQQALEDIARIKKGETAVLSLALNSTLNRYHAPALLERYCRDHPHGRIKVTEMPSRGIIHAVLSDRTDLGLGPFQHNMSAFDTWSLYRETRVLVIGPRHPGIPAPRRFGAATGRLSSAAR